MRTHWIGFSATFRTSRIGCSVPTRPHETISTCRRAKTDLAGIRRYIAADKPSAADRLIGRFFEIFHLLGKQPLLGQRCPEFGEENLRMFTLGNYVIFFRPVENGVEIARVVSGFRDLEALF